MPPAGPADARPVGAFQLLALGLNGIIGVGIFFAPATVAAGAPGLGSVAVFALTGLALLPTALTFATLGQRFDVDGGPVVFARAAFGERASFMVGWVVQNNDLDAAAKALSHARSLMPNAPALATGLDGALNQAREAEKQAAERAARETAARNEQARRLQEAAERQAQAIQATQLPGAPQEEKPAPAKPGARLIDPAAASSAVPLPMLDSQDNDILRELLDAVAADVVAFDCAVRVEVRQAKDYPWVAALLSARVKKLDPAFGLRLSQSLKPEQVPRLVLSPRR